MKKNILAWMMLLSCVAASAQVKTLQVTVANNWAEDKQNEPVVVKLPAQKKIGFEVKGAKVTCGGNEVACQLDDMNGDLRADELFFLVVLKGKETKTYDVTLYAAPSEHEVPARIYTALQLRDKQDKHPDVLRVEASGKSDIFNDIYMHGITVRS